MATRTRNVSFEIENLEEFLRNLEQKERDAEKGMSAALREEAHQELERSRVLVPVGETGDLKRSGFVGLVTRWARGFEVRWGYGEPYALYQHYGYYEHDDGQRLFVERPFKYSSRGLVDRIKRTLARYLF